VVATDGVNWPQRRAEAMTRLAGAWLRDQRPPKPLTDQVEVLIHVNANAATSDRRIAAEDTCRLDSGEFLAPSVVWRLACDARVRTVIEDGAGNVLDIGRRTLPTRLKFHYAPGTAVVVFLAALRVRSRVTTSNTGPTAVPRASTIS